MLSYQHAYHAGNKADIHKHEFLARLLAVMVKKDKPLTYIETHSGRAIYDLSSVEAEKTGEARAGILQTDTGTLDDDYDRVIKIAKTRYGPSSYPGSPMIAKTLLRPCDYLHLCELHPQEFKHLEKAIAPDKRVTLYHADGLKHALKLCPPTPRRGVLMIDPSYEVKAEYDAIPDFIAQIHKKWNVGVIILWYPILPSGAHEAMIDALERMDFPKNHKNEVLFDTGLNNHRLKGSGLYVINMPWLNH